MTVRKSITTNVKRSKYTDISPMCTFCNEKIETMLHVFWECKHVKKLWKTLQRWLKYVININVSFNASMIIYNNYKGECKDTINCFILIAKQYVYRVKCYRQPINFAHMLTNVYQIENVEQWVAKANNTFVKHLIKWGKLIQL